jgi:tetratricopeptide (TPR) repeat protein
VLDARKNILAGTKYLDSRLLRCQFISDKYDRIRCAVASYNAGYTHVRRAIAKADSTQFVDYYNKLPNPKITGPYVDRIIGYMVWLEQNPNDVTARFNLSIALFHVGDYLESVREFEIVENQLPFRTLWYQIEPIQAYDELGNYERVFEVTNKILNNHNRAFSELYIIRGQIYQKNGQKELARNAYEDANRYNQNLTQAWKLLQSLQ